MPEKEVEAVTKALEARFQQALSAGRLSQVAVIPNCSILAAVGQKMARTPTVGAILFNALAKAAVLKEKSNTDLRVMGIIGSTTMLLSDRSVIYKEQARLNQAASNSLLARLEAQKEMCDSSERALVRPYALSWKPCQGDSLNLPDHRIHKDGDGDASFQLESNSLPHAHAQTTKTFYKHQDSRIMKAQELKTKTSAQTLILKITPQKSSFGGDC
ncbi:hypothetical protein Tco_1507809 [Tanacetum coccineum]